MDTKEKNREAARKPKQSQERKKRPADKAAAKKTSAKEAPRRRRPAEEAGFPSSGLQRPTGGPGRPGPYK